MSVLNVKTEVHLVLCKKQLQEVIETEKNTPKMREDRTSMLRENMLAAKMIENNTSLLREQLMVSWSTVDHNTKKINSIMIQRHTTIRIKYIALQDEYLALAKCTTGKEKL